MRNLKGLLWDVDGTLADTERDGHRVAFNKAFSESGLDWNWDVALYGQLLAVTGGKERIRYYLEHFNKDWAYEGDLDRFVAELHQQKSQHFVSMMENGEIPLRPGVKRLVTEAVHQGLTLAIVTTTTPANVEALINQYFPSQGRPVFQLVAAGDIVPNKKPAPDIYVWALKELGLNADQCLAIEDSHNGLQAALGAGIERVLITTNEYTRTDDFTGASLVVDQLGESNAPSQILSGNDASPALIDVGLLRRLHELS